jgi:metal transporter CNNM
MTVFSDDIVFTESAVQSPVGIVTFEDIIDTILQKTSRDENDFFDRPTSTPPTKSKKVGDYSPRSLSLEASPQTVPFQSNTQRSNLFRKIWLEQAA